MPDQQPWSEKTPIDDAKGNNSQAIIQAIRKMLSSVGQVAGQPQSGSTEVAPQRMGPSPTPTINFTPGGAPGGPIQTARPPGATQVPPTGSQSIGHFQNRGEATNAGLVSLGNSLSGLFGAVEEKEHNKKAAMAENYLMQINGLLASGDPGDKEKAKMFLEDPKIRKILKTGLEYVPLEEEVPPEAKGVQSAVQKIQKQQQGGQPGGGGQPQGGAPQRQPVLPQASQEQQLKSMMTQALLQKIKQDPAAAIQMTGQSQLSSAEQHAAEFYKNGLGLSPKQIESMSSIEKIQGMKVYEQATVAAIKGEIDMYKAGLGYSGKVDSAKIMANARKYVADQAKAAMDNRMKSKTGKGTGNSAAAGAKIYSGLAAKYLDIIKNGKGSDGIKPLTEEQKKVYQQKADALQKQADEYLNQAGDAELMEMFQKALEEEPDATPDESNE